MPDPAYVVDTTVWRALVDEQMGARDKEWLAAPASEGGGSWLFKRPRSLGLPELGADLWAEYIACRVARGVSVPAAEVRLAVRGPHRGVISRQVGGDLAHGNELLAARNPTYQAGEKGRVPGYDLASIEAVLEPYEGSEPGLTAYESFAGYLAFDALIGNTDRHHENWAVLRDERRLAPTYDHGASLGFNVPILRRADAAAAAAKARSRHFSRVDSLVDLAFVALDRASQGVRDLWLARMAGLDEESVHVAVAEVPSDWMSESARTFVVDFVQANKRRLTP
ncbi:MAG: HipA domain-containing protein [Actinomycetes bacterium]